MAIVDLLFKIAVVGFIGFFIPFCVRFHKLMVYAIKTPIAHVHEHLHKHQDVKITRNVPKEHFEGFPFQAPIVKPIKPGKMIPSAHVEESHGSH